MPIRLHESAKREYLIAVRWYLSRSPTTAARLIAAVADAQIRIRLHPSTFPETIRPGYRYLVVKRFPYRLVYKEEGTEIVIYAVAHHKRRPEYWSRRT